MRESYLMTEIFIRGTKKSNISFKKIKYFQCFHRSNNDKQLLDRLKDLHTQINFLTEKSKGKYYS